MIRRLFPRLVAAEPVIVALLAPLLLFPGTIRGLLAMAVVPMLWGVRWLHERHFVRRTPLDVSILLILAMVTVSALVTVDWELSFPKIAGVILGVASYYAIVGAVRRFTDIWLVIGLVIAVSCGVACISLVGTAWLQKIPVLDRIVALLPVAIRGVPGSPPEGFHPNTVAGTLVWVVPLLLLLARAYATHPLPLLPKAWQFPGRLTFWAACALVGGTLLLTQSRGGYLGGICGMVALFVFPHPRLRWSALVMVILLISAGTVFGSQMIEAYNQIEEVQTSGVANPASLKGRLEVWSSALALIENVPFTGIGMGTFRIVMPVLYPVSIASPDYDFGHAHNHLLAAAVDLGIPGLLGYLALWIGAGTMLYVIYCQTTFPEWRMLALGLGGGMVGHFVFGITDATVLGSKPGLLFWLVMGLTAALHQLFIQETRCDNSRPVDGA